MSAHEDERATLATGYALGILTPEERREYEAYLAEHGGAVAEARASADAVAALEGGGPEEAPPAALKDAIMGQLASTPQLPPGRPADAGETSPGAPEAPLESVDASPETGEAPPEASETPHGPAEARARSRWFRRPALLVAAAAAAVVLFAGGTLFGTTLGGGSGQGGPVSHASAAVAEVAAASDAQRSSSRVSGGGEATLLWSLDVGRSVIVLRGLDRLPADKTYQLWYIRGGKATSAGLLAADGGRWHLLDGRVKDGDVVGLTVEPKGGSSSPTTKPLVTIAT